MNAIETAQAKFAELIAAELTRIAAMKQNNAVKDFTRLERIKIGILPGDGIGPGIMQQALRVLKLLAKDEIAAGKLELRHIDGMTIDERARRQQSLPDDVLAQIKECDVILKGPITTPRPGDPWPNMVSANSLLRRALDLFAAVRPVSIPQKNVDWTFFRENIEGEYLWGNKGIQVTDDLAVDFKVQTQPGSERIARQAFEFARKNGKTNVTVVTKSNIIKLVDGNFLKTVRKVGEEYPEIDVQERLVDVMCARLADEGFNKGLEVFVLPNLYGDIVTDIAAELQGGLGTAASANIGDRYAMFEAIHGSAPGLMQAGLGDYADPCSLIRAVGMLLAHIGYGEKNQLLGRALYHCTVSEKKLKVTTRPEDASAAQFTDYLLETLSSLR